MNTTVLTAIKPSPYSPAKGLAARARTHRPLNRSARVSCSLQPRHSRFSGPQQAGKQHEGESKIGKSITIPVKSNSNEKLVGAALAEVFRRNGSCSAVCHELHSLQQCYRVISCALSLLSPDVWVSFKEVGRLSKHPNGTVFRSLKFTLEKGLGSRVENTGYEEFQVTAKTRSQKLAEAMEIVLHKQKTVGLRSVGFSALLNATNATKRVRRDYRLSRTLLVVRPKVVFVKDYGDPEPIERIEITCARIPYEGSIKPQNHRF